MQRRIQGLINREGLVGKGDHLVVAVSGGADSVCLLHHLSSLSEALSFSLTVLHVHHGIRGEEANEDTRFVESLAQALGHPFLMIRKRVPQLAKRKGLSLEMAAREARHQAFRAAIKETGATAVCTAHTLDDQAETVLLKLSRGAGTSGLGAMPYRQDIDGLVILRPLLDTTRSELISWLRKEKQCWREDSSNADVSILRNRIRHKLLPDMEQQLNPSLRETLHRTADILRADDEWLDALSRDMMNQALEAEGLNTSILNGFPLAARRRVLRVWLMQAGLDAQSLDFAVVDRVLELASKQAGTKSLELPGGKSVRRQYRFLSVISGSEEKIHGFCHNLPPLGEYIAVDAGIRVRLKHEAGINRRRPERAGEMPASATISAKAVGRSRITMRSWQAGDRISPLGMDGSKKLQDVFSDARLPKQLRSRLPIFECRGTIIYVPGYRVARGWEAASDEALNLQLHVEYL